MEYETESHRFGETIVRDNFSTEWMDLVEAIKEISDEDIMSTYVEKTPKQKSISRAINILLKENLEGRGWESETAIFNDSDYQTGTRWRLDFSKEVISVEVAFNHGEAIAWNLLKPVLASELNHVRKQKQTKVGVVIMATEEMRKAGDFDSAVGTFEKAKRYLKPLQNQLSCPMVLIGLKAPRTFRVEKKRIIKFNYSFIKYYCVVFN